MLGRLLMLAKHVHVQRQPYTNAYCTAAVSGAVENTSVHDTMKEFVLHHVGRRLSFACKFDILASEAGFPLPWYSEWPLVHW